MPIPANQITVAEVSLKGSMDSGGGNIVNTNFVFHYRRLGVTNPPDKATLKTGFVGGVGLTIGAALNVRWNASFVDIRWLNDATDPYVSFTSTLSGVITGDSLSSFQAAYLLIRTSLRGKAYRGAKHLGPMSESDITTTDEDLWNAGALTRLGTVCTAIMTDIITADNTWRSTVVSKTYSQLSLNPTTVIATDASAALPRKSVGSMLRRKVKSVY
jgi:hypothetical protein